MSDSPQAGLDPRLYPVVVPHHVHFTASQRLRRALRRACIALGWYGPLLRRVEARLVERRPAVTPRGTLLALMPERFRKDLDVFVDKGYRVLEFPKDWQDKLLELFWDERTDFDRYFRLPEGSHTARQQERLRRFLAGFLDRLRRRNGIDAMISAAAHYISCLDYGAAARRCGLPFLVLHRECFQTNKGQYERTRDFGVFLNRLEADFIIFHNEITRQAFVESGHSPAERSAALGCMRMDQFLERARTHRRTPGGRKSVVLFSFTHCTSIGGGCTGFYDGRTGFVRLFEATHGRIVELAARHPELDVVIKTKWGGNWFAHIEEAAKARGLSVKDIPNLRVIFDADAQELILDADVVLAFGSTTMAEAAIAGKPVVTPNFAECLQDEYRDYVQLADYLEAFDVAKSEDDIERLVLHRLEHPEITEAQTALRRELFERYVSPLDGRAADRYVQCLENLRRERAQGGRS